MKINFKVIIQISVACKSNFPLHFCPFDFVFHDSNFLWVPHSVTEFIVTLYTLIKPIYQSGVIYLRLTLQRHVFVHMFDSASEI